MKVLAIVCVLIMLIVASFFLTRAIHRNQNPKRRIIYMSIADLFYVLVVLATAHLSMMKF